MSKPVRVEPGVKMRDADKMALIPVQIVPTERDRMLRKPSWLKVKLPSTHSALTKSNRPCAVTVYTQYVRRLLAQTYLSVLIGCSKLYDLGDICTRRCPFCDVAHGRPLPPDPEEAVKLGKTIHDMGVKYVVITSVDHAMICVMVVRNTLPIVSAKSVNTRRRFKSRYWCLTSAGV